MTTTPVDMMSEAWIDKIEAETKTSEQTFKSSKKMTVATQRQGVICGLMQKILLESKGPSLTPGPMSISES